MKELYEAYKKAKEEYEKARDDYCNVRNEENNNNCYVKTNEFRSIEAILMKELGNKALILGNTVIFVNNSYIIEKEIL